MNQYRSSLRIYIADVLQGDFGNSLRQNRPVVTILVERLPMTMELALSAFILASIVGIPVGVFAATRRNSAADVGVMIGANLGVSIPVFWLGLMLAYLFAIILKDTAFSLPPFRATLGGSDSNALL